MFLQLSVCKTFRGMRDKDALFDLSASMSRIFAILKSVEMFVLLNYKLMH
jgi:hypothetical protein